MKNDNHIKIPWYRRNIAPRQPDVQGIPPLNIRFPRTPRPTTPVRQPQTVRQPETQPAPEPSTQPVRVPVPDPTAQPSPLPPWLPRREGEVQGQPEQPFPFPSPFPERQPFPQPLPLFPFLDPDFDWIEHASRLPRAETKPAAPEPEMIKNPIQQAFENLIKPVIWLFVANELKNRWVEAKITDPIYKAMYDDPVLGLALREAEKSNLDMEAVANYFAYYDWDNFDLEEFKTGLTAIVGAAAAARIIVFFVGRRVVFRI